MSENFKVKALKDIHACDNKKYHLIMKNGSVYDVINGEVKVEHGDVLPLTKEEINKAPCSIFYHAVEILEEPKCEYSRPIRIEPQLIGDEKFFRLKIGDQVTLLTQAEAESLAITVEDNSNELYGVNF